MTFDDQLRTTFDRLTDRLREDVGRMLADATTDLSAAVEAERADAARAVADAKARVEEEVAARLAAAEERGREAGRRDGLAAGKQEAAAEMEAAVAAAEAARKAARVEALDEGRQLGLAQGREEGRLEGLAQGRDEGRQEGLTQGRSEGRQEGLAQGRAEGWQEAVAQASAEQNTASAAIERLADAIRAIDRAGSLSETLDTLVGSAGREAARVGVLLVRGTELRSWRFIGFGTSLDDGSPIRLSMADAGILAEAIRTGSPVAADGKSPAPSFAELPRGRDALALPVPMSGQVVAVLYADQGPADRAAQPAAVWAGRLEIMTRHAARCLEAVTAVRAVQARAGDGRPGAGSAQDDQEQAARRYARLLVSEIKLYHEAEVLAGRRERDLGTRLGGEIARARVLYEQRVARPVPHAADHFQAELVKTLADGDATLLEASL
jgi:flagellar biosynthesis/type III secretory pathway protein FliH